MSGSHNLGEVATLRNSPEARIELFRRLVKEVEARKHEVWPAIRGSVAVGWERYKTGVVWEVVGAVAVEFFFKPLGEVTALALRVLERKLGRDVRVFGKA